MPQAKIAHVEIESLDEFDAHIQHATVLRDWTIQSIDLTGRAAALARVDVSGALFLGCQLPQELEDELRDRGALVFSTLPSVPFNPYRNSMYRAVDLYDALLSGGQYATTFDARVYAWAQTQSTPPAIPASLAMSLHDHALTDALDDFFTGRDDTDAIGIMGGHATLRGSDDYIGAARLLLQRCRGGLVYLPGAAGTVQEIFQAATRNYYAPDDFLLSPMILVDVEHWTKTLPAWPLLEALGKGRSMARETHVVDTIDEAAEILLG